MDVRQVLVHAGLLLAVVGHGAMAAPVTLMGDQVSFTFDDAFVGVYGTPFVSGNSLLFTPADFSAVSNNGQGAVVNGAVFSVSIAVLDGYRLPSLVLVEGGDYHRIGDDALVGFSGTAVLADNEHGFSQSVSIAPAAPFSASTTLASYATTDWEAYATLAIPGAWSNDLSLELNHTLMASTTDFGSSAFIQKKLLISAAVVSNVPEPEAALMWLVGLGLLGSAARRHGRKDCYRRST